MEFYFLMAKDIKDIKFSRDTILIAIGVFLLVVFLTVIVYAFMFLINNVLPAITTDDNKAGGNEIRFNIKGFEELGL